MEPLRYILYLFCFFLIGAIFYVWSVKKTEGQSWDFTRELYKKGAKEIEKALKRKEYMSFQELLPVIRDLSVHPPFSTQKMGITEPERFLKALLSYMQGDRLIEEEQKDQTLYYRLKKGQV